MKQQWITGINFVRCLLAGLFLCFSANTFGQQKSNDHIFPSAATAQPFIDFDSKGFLINGKRTFLVSAGMEYARVPHELWHDRLLRLKRGGFNCIEVYTFWDFHEPQEGRFSFSGDHDLGLFLQQVHELGMYAICRVGPYYCAEWVNGGFPEWLRFKPDVQVRQDNPAFMKCVNNFFDTLYPVIFKQQINHGGPVIMVQLENEHPDSWGTYIPDGYFRKLQEKAVAKGLEVPYFFSGLHHSSDPAGDDALDNPTRPNPWFSTEFWSVWYTSYSSGIKEADMYERRTMKIIAHGGNGYNYYMAHGGTNFGYTNNNEDAASYDYGAAVGQAGDLRPIYYSFKKMGLFAQSFQDVLENSTDATLAYKGFTADTALKVSARHSIAGDIIFLDNPSSSTKKNIVITTNGTAGRFTDTVALMPQQILPVVHNFDLGNGLKLDWCATKIFGICKQGATTSIVIYGEPATTANMIFSATASVKILAGKEGMASSKKMIKLHTNFTANSPVEYSFISDGQTIRIIAVSTQLAGRTWFVQNKKDKYVVIGPAYVGDVIVKNSTCTIETEEPWLNKRNLPTRIYGSSFSTILKKEKSTNSLHLQTVKLGDWKAKDAAIFAAANYNDIAWKKTTEPLQMGADGDLSADAWYRTDVTIDTAGAYTLAVQGADRATTFVDGNLAGKADISNAEISYDFSKGKHTLAFFTAHDGLDKFFGVLGPINNIDQKGLYGPASLKKGASTAKANLTDWHFIKVNNLQDADKAIPALTDTGWANYTIGQDAFAHQQGFGWFATSIPMPPPIITKITINFKSTDENATIFINGNKIVRHEGWNQPFTISVDNAAVKSWPMQLAVFIENYSNNGGIDGAVRISYNEISTPLTAWRMMGGTGDVQKLGSWKAVDSSHQIGRPAFYQTDFKIVQLGSKNDYPIWRIATTSLGHGSVWINGHNLGRYPEKIAAPGLYIPECWLKAGSNNMITIYDEDGKSPAAVTITPEAAASREVDKATFKW